MIVSDDVLPTRLKVSNSVGGGVGEGISATLSLEASLSRTLAEAPAGLVLGVGVTLATLAWASAPGLGIRTGLRLSERLSDGFGGALDLPAGLALAVAKSVSSGNCT